MEQKAAKRRKRTKATVLLLRERPIFSWKCPNLFRDLNGAPFKNSYIYRDLRLIRSHFVYNRQNL